MKLRIDLETYALLTRLHTALGFSRAEIVRRCLRGWERAGRPRVEKAFHTKTATRDDSESFDMDLGAFADVYPHRTVLAVVRQKLSKLDWTQIHEQTTETTTETDN